RFNGNPASGLGVKLASGANEMATAKLVLDRLNELAQYFPHGLIQDSPVGGSVTLHLKKAARPFILAFRIVIIFIS
ncbi:efflux RND transporter permease subunit, partial [Salmonella enterica subsp. enterica serovar Muenster]|nr:efflux RND transporter permease subunit [Salmonella enterica subsp. enterica serovar Muenster]